jgi:hypothetical protein
MARRTKTMSDSSCGIHAMIHCGALVDGYLSGEGAIAQAVDRKTILVHSSVFGLGTSDQRLVMLHECAHLQQMATPGYDPVRALEEEAWEAADAWIVGRSYHVRGKARRPLNALAIIQGGERGHPFAPPWYRSDPVEPIGNNSKIVVKDVTVLEDMTLESIMDTIINAKEKEILVVSHGWSEGLALPLMKGRGITGGAQRQQIFPLSADRAFDDGPIKTPIISVKDVADHAHLSEQQVTALRAKMNQIRSLGLDHVAFRACDMGQSTDSLQAFRNFLGAKSVSAPKLQDSYGQFTSLIGGSVDAWAKTKRKEGFRVSVDLQVGFGIKNTAPLVYKIVSRAADDKAFAAWVKVHITDRVALDKVIVYHGMILPSDQLSSPNAPPVFFIRDSSFISNIVFYDG